MVIESAMRLEVIINIDAGDSRIAEALLKSLMPDDKGAPKNISISNCVVSGKYLIYRIDVDLKNSEDFLTAANVVDDVLRHAALVIKLLGTLKIDS